MGLAAPQLDPAPAPAGDCSRQVWDTIVTVTNQVGTREASAMRVLLYMSILSGEKCGPREHLRSAWRLVRLLFSRPRRSAPVVTAGVPLFAFLYDTPANMNNLLPVFQAAHGRGWRPAALAANRIDLKQKGLAEDFLSAEQLIGMSTWLERLAAILGARRHVSALRRGFREAGPEWGSRVSRLSSRLIMETAMFSAATAALRRLYTQSRPSCVVSTSDLWPFDHAVFAEARHQRIPSFVIQHGVAARFWWPCVADQLLLWGEAFRNELLSFGAPGSRLAGCGMPATDRLFLADRRNRKERGAGPSIFVVLSDTQGASVYPQLYAAYRQFFREIVKATPEIVWRVKLHPVENPAFYQEMIDARLANFEILPKSTNLPDAVTQADVCCTLWSTAGLEAMVMRSPLVVFNLAPLIEEHAWWPRSGGGMFLHTLDEFVEFARRCRSDGRFLVDLVEKQDRFLAESFANPGHAAEAVLDQISAVISAEADDRDVQVRRE